jgi:hypothetical protein
LQPTEESDCHSAAVVDLYRDIVVTVVDGCAGSRVREEFKYQYKHKNVITPSPSYAFTGGGVVVVIKMKV